MTLSTVHTRKSLLDTAREINVLWGPTGTGTVVVQGAVTQEWVLRVWLHHSGNSSLYWLVYLHTLLLQKPTCSGSSSHAEEPEAP